MDDLEKIKQKIDIADLVGQYITLKKAGRNFKALCPFHTEKSPSFVVSPERGIWHCFGCSKGGDIFSFLMEYDRLDFSEALHDLANRAGIQLSSTPALSEIEKKKGQIFQLNALAAQYYHYILLNHPIGKPALDYLIKTRKIPRGLIEKFHLGYAPNNFRALTEFLIQKKKHNKDELIDAGLIAEKNGRVFDFFRHRIIFPITNPHGDIMAFSGRALDNITMPKYINTRETAVYKKGDTLFGLDHAIEEIKRERKVILVEGEFDVISAFHEGIKNIAAIKGTALTESQIKILKRYADKILFCLDNDPAGSQAQRRSIEMIEKMGLLANVIRLPHGKDPDELLQTNPLEFKQALKNDISVYDFVIDSTATELDVASIDGKRALVERTLPFLLSIQNEVVKEHYLKKLAQHIDTSLDALLREGQKLARPQISAEQHLPTQKKSREQITEEYLLSLLLQAEKPGEYCIIVNSIISNISFSIPAYDRLFQELKEYCETHQTFVVNEFAAKLPQELLPSFDQCFLAPLSQFKVSEEYRVEIEKTAREVKLLAVKSKLRTLSSEMKSREKDGNDDDIQLLRVEFKQLSELLK